MEIIDARAAPMIDPAKPILAVKKKTVTADSPDAAIWAKEIFLKKFLQRPEPADLFFRAVISSRVPVAFIGYRGAFVERSHGPPGALPLKAGPKHVVHVQQCRPFGKV